MNNDYKVVYNNAIYFASVLLVFGFVGFFRTYFGLIPHFEKSPNLIHWHFAFLMSWVILLVVQPLLIRYKKVRIHRMLGKVTYVLAPLVVLSLCLLLRRYYNKYHLEEYPVLDMLIACHSQAIHIFQFILFYVLALAYKRKVVLHASFMTATGIIFINPSLTRALEHVFSISYQVAESYVIAITNLTIFILLFYTKSKGVNYKPYLFIFAIMLLHDIPMLLKIWYWYA